MEIKGGQLRILTSGELYDIHLATLEILERIGVKVLEQKALRTLGEAGVHIDVKEKTARIPEYLVKGAIKKAPSGFTLFGRDRAISEPSKYVRNIHARAMKKICDEVELYYEEVYIITLLRKYSWRFE